MLFYYSHIFLQMSGEGLDNGWNVILINTILTSLRVSASPFSIEIILIMKMYGCLCCNNIFMYWIVQIHEIVNPFANN